MAKNLTFLFIILVNLNSSLTLADSKSRSYYAKAIFSTPGLPDTLAGGMPITFIKFKHQPENTKVLGVTAAHWLEPEVQKPGARDAGMYREWDQKGLPNDYVEDWIKLYIAKRVPDDAYLQGVADDTMQAPYIHGPYPWMWPEGGVNFEAKPLLVMHSPSDLLLLEFNLSYTELFDRFQIVPFIVKESQPIRGQLYHFNDGYYHETRFCTFQEIESSRVVTTAGGNTKTLLNQLIFTPVSDLPLAMQDFGREDCYSYGGTSGSAVISADTNEIIGVISAAKFADINMFKVSEMLSQPLKILKDCFDKNYSFSKNEPNCEISNQK